MFGGSSLEEWCNISLGQRLALRKNEIANRRIVAWGVANVFSTLLRNGELEYYSTIHMMVGHTGVLVARSRRMMMTTDRYRGNPELRVMGSLSMHYAKHGYIAT